MTQREGDANQTSRGESQSEREKQKGTRGGKQRWRVRKWEQRLFVCVCFFTAMKLQLFISPSVPEAANSQEKLFKKVSCLLQYFHQFTTQNCFSPQKNNSHFKYWNKPINKILSWSQILIYISYNLLQYISSGRKMCFECTIVKLCHFKNTVRIKIICAD